MMLSRTIYPMALLLLCMIEQEGWAQDTLQTQRLQGVEVRADYRHRMMNSTSPLQMIDHQEMLHLGVTDIADALNRLSGVNLRDYGGAGGMKTVSVRGFGAKHTGVAYDGILLSECQSGEIDVARYALDNVQSLRLVIGDNDDIFIPARQAASAAVLSIETMNEIPIDCQPHLTSQLRVGSFGYVSPFVRYVQRLNDKLTLAVTGDYLHGDNDYPFTLRNGNTKTKEHRTNSEMNSGHVEIDGHYRFNAYHQLWGKVYYYDNNRELPGVVRYYTNVCGERLHDRNLFVQARWITQGKDERWMLKVNAKWNWASSAYQDTLKAGRKDDASYWQREGYLSAAFLYRIGKRWMVDYSADYAFQNLNSSLATDNHPYRHSVLQSLTAKYAISRLTILGRLLYSAYLNGAEQGKSSKDVSRLSPSLSLSYKLLPSETLYLRASYKDIFRVPTFNESYFFHYGSTDLQPENTDQYNLGMTWQREWGGVLSTLLTIDGYWNHVRDKIVGVPYNMFIWRTINVAKVETQGLDVNAKVSWLLARGQQLELSGNWSYQRVMNRSNKASEHYGKQIAYTPLNSGGIALGWQNPWVNLSLHGAGSSGRWANNNHYEDTRIDGYWEMGLTAYRTIGKAWNLRLDLKNITNAQYEIVAHYPMPGFSWQASMCYQF